MSPAEIAVLKLGLSLRIYSTRVEMFSQMAENKNISTLECYNVVDIGGKFTCSIEEIDKLITKVIKTLLFKNSISLDSFDNFISRFFSYFNILG